MTNVGNCETSDELMKPQGVPNWFHKSSQTNQKIKNKSLRNYVFANESHSTLKTFLSHFPVRSKYLPQNFFKDFVSHLAL